MSDNFKNHKTMNKLLRILLLSIVSLFWFSSCTEEPDSKYNTVNLVKSPDVIVYSGQYILGASTRSANVNGNIWYQNWDRPTNVTEEEIAKVLSVVSEPMVGVKNSIHIDWENYWVQQVYTGKQEYVDGYGNNIGTGSSHMNHLLAYNSNYEEEVWWPEHVINKGGYEHIDNFNNGSNSTVYIDDETNEQYIGTTLMVNMNADGVIDQFGYHNSTDSKNHFEYIIIEVDGSYYVCFDFYATHPEGQDANKNMDVERDWVFNDWIVKISPAYHKGETPKVDDSIEEQTPPIVNEDTSKHTHSNEVEVNLHLEANKDTVSHLSIHVRAATDVEVFIPVPVEYYCEADDMAIVMKHEPNHMGHGGPYSYTYTLKDSDLQVTLNVAFENEGIRIWTEGINQEVIDWCAAKCNGDGITFEVWNYFNGVISKDELRDLLNQSTIRFLDNDPDSYINAFTDIDGSKNEDDCTVSPPSNYPESSTGTHLNGSSYNEIYNKSN